MTVLPVGTWRCASRPRQRQWSLQAACALDVRLGQRVEQFDAETAARSRRSGASRPSRRMLPPANKRRDRLGGTISGRRGCGAVEHARDTIGARCHRLPRRRGEGQPPPPFSTRPSGATRRCFGAPALVQRILDLASAAQGRAGNRAGALLFRFAEPARRGLRAPASVRRPAGTRQRRHQLARGDHRGIQTSAAGTGSPARKQRLRLLPGTSCSSARCCRAGGSHLRTAVGRRGDADAASASMSVR